MRASATPGQGRRIAVFPGAFRPPHVNHHATAMELLERDDVDELVIVVSGRHRGVPGTTKVLGPEPAARVWDRYLGDRPDVRIEIAEMSAVGRALDLVQQARPGERILLCVGIKDFHGGDGRFKKLAERRLADGVEVQVVSGAPDVRDVSGTALRAAMGAGPEGRDAFLAALPSHLDREERIEVWELCRAAMVEQRDVLLASVRSAVESSVGPVRSLHVAPGSGADAAVRVELEDGRTLYVKHAGDTVTTDGELGTDRKPRKRLKTEREGLKWVRAVAWPEVTVPEVVRFDKASRTLALSDVGRGRRSLADRLASGDFDPGVASTLGRVLAGCRLAGSPPEPFRDIVTADARHWCSVLRRATIDLAAEVDDAALAPMLRDLGERSLGAGRRGFVHLDLTPANVLVGGQAISWIDFETSSTVGDPAFDIGTLAGHYLYWALRLPWAQRSGETVAALLAAYRARVGEAWKGADQRIGGFVAVGLLQAWRRDDPSDGSQRSRFLAAARVLVAGIDGLMPVESIVDAVVTTGRARGHRTGV